LATLKLARGPETAFWEVDDWPVKRAKDRRSGRLNGFLVQLDFPQKYLIASKSA
jgi:hypothetical protein